MGCAPSVPAEAIPRDAPSNKKVDDDEGGGSDDDSQQDTATASATTAALRVAGQEAERIRAEQEAARKAQQDEAARKAAVDAARRGKDRAGGEGDTGNAASTLLDSGVAPMPRFLRDQAGSPLVGPPSNADHKGPGDQTAQTGCTAIVNDGVPDKTNDEAAEDSKVTGIGASTAAAAAENAAEVVLTQPDPDVAKPCADTGSSQQQQPLAIEPQVPESEGDEQPAEVTGIAEEETVTAVGEPGESCEHTNPESEKDTPPGAAVVDEQQQLPGATTPTAVVTRREVRELSEAEVERTAKALLHMMQRHGAEEQSEFFRVAGMHGYPGSWCHHAQETFPSWHRFFLVEFEQALRAADRALGNDGAIGCPYWDWTREEVNGQVIPALITRFFEAVPKSLIEDLGEQAVQFPGGCYERRSERQLVSRLRSAELGSLVEQSLGETQHWMHASTRWGGRTSIETPHNRVHVAVGWPMSSVEFAAFDPMFWLHHCNIDRLYQAYLEAHPDSLQEMAAVQRNLQEQQGEPNRFEAVLEPFVNPKTGEPARPEQAFSCTAELLFAYDTLPEAPPARQRQPPTLALFKDIKIQDSSQGQCYELHVFVVKRDSVNTSCGKEGPGHLVDVTVDTDWVPPEDQDLWPEQPGYAGFGAVFARSAEKCSNCATRGPVTESVDISAALHKLGISAREQANLRVAVVNERMAVLPLSRTSIPPPTIIMPLFGAMGDNIKKREEPPDGEISEQMDVMAIQAYLTYQGYDVGPVDGWMGSKTENALVLFQDDTGVQGDVKGSVGPATIEALNRKRMDGLPFRGGHPNAAPTGTIAIKAKGTGAITYFVGAIPGYLSKEATLKEIACAFLVWEEAAGTEALIRFEAATSKEEADCTVAWTLSDMPSSWSDGAGGSLAVTGDNYIHLDHAERWLLQGQDAAPGQFKMLPVLIHEIGHLLGLEHTHSIEDTMFPFYMESKLALSANDKEKLSKLVVGSAMR